MGETFYGLVEHSDYAVVIQPLPSEDGGGFVAFVPDLPGCMSDGKSRDEAARNATDAIAAWVEEAAAPSLRHPAAKLLSRRSAGRTPGGPCCRASAW